MPRLAAFITPGRSLEQAQTQAGLADSLGYDLVCTTHVRNRDALATLVAYGRSTSRVRLGTGVYPMLHVSPLALGQLAASIDEQLGGRLVLGIGTSHRPLIEGWHGRPFPASPLAAMRDTIAILRSLWRDGRVDHRGTELSATGFRFSGFEPRADLPIHVAALGPRMLRLAGELADGVMLWLASPDHVRDVVVPNVAAGAERAGRDPAEVEIVPAVPCVVSDDRDAAHDAFRRRLVPYLSLPFYRSMLRDAGFGTVLDAFDRALADEGRAAAAARIPTEMLDTLGGFGTAAQVRATVEAFRAAGATLPAVSPLVAERGAGVDAVLLAAVGEERR